MTTNPEVYEGIIEDSDYVPDVPQDAPPPEPFWMELVVDEWYGIWTDKEWVGHIRAELHIPALKRLFTYKNMWYDVNARLQDVDAPALVTGSRGNLVANPLYAELRKLEETILRMEKEFGMTLRSASLINMQLGEGAKNWAEVREQQKADKRAVLKKQAAKKLNEG